MRVEEMTFEELRNIVRRLPQTADGVPVIHGDEVYLVVDHELHVMTAHGGGMTARGETYSHGTHRCYSTPEAAAAAAAKEAADGNGTTDQA